MAYQLLGGTIEIRIPYLGRRNLDCDVAGAKVGAVVTIQCRVGAGTTNRLSKSSALRMEQYIHSTIFALAMLQSIISPDWDTSCLSTRTRYLATKEANLGRP